MEKRVTENYQKPNAYKYGLKIVSPFVDEFGLLVGGGGEFVEVMPNSEKIMENNGIRSRLLVVHVHENASFEYLEKVKGEVNGKCDVHIFLEGRGAKAKISGSYDISKESKLDIYHKIYHEAPETVSEIVARGVLRDQSYVIYRSDIAMKKGFKNLTGIQDARFLNLSKESRIDAIPSLDIAVREVTCSHSLSISNLREEDLFYSKTRGLSDQESRALIAEGFLA